MRGLTTVHRGLTIAATVVGVLLMRVPFSEAVGLVFWPNCAAPGDSVYLKSGGWPAYGQGDYQVLWVVGGPLSDGPACFGIESGGTEGRQGYRVHPMATPGEYATLIFPSGCVYAGPDSCYDCISVPGFSPYKCWRGSLRVVTNPGNALHAYVNKVYAARTLDALIVDEFTYDASDMCNTSPCSAVKFIQAMKPMVTLLGVEQYKPMAQIAVELAGSKPYWSHNDTFSTDDDWRIDNQSDDFRLRPVGPGGALVWVNVGGGETDPYGNGDDDVDRFPWGATGSIGGGPADSSVFRDQPQMCRGEFVYGYLGITKIIGEFEVNAFCADGDNQGEWLGRLKWRWEKSVGQEPIATILETPDPKAKPTDEFMKALALFCQKQPCVLPGLTFPDSGGEHCVGKPDP